MTMVDVDTLESAAARLDAAVADIGRLPAESRAVAEEFALSLDALSKEGLTAIVRTLKADPRGKELLFELVDEPSVRMLLGMHGIIRMPDPAATPEATAPAPHTAPRKVAFVSLEAMLRGPRETTVSACGTGEHACGPESCGCGAH